MSRNYADFNNITTISGSDFLVGYRSATTSGELRGKISDILAVGNTSTRILGVSIDGGGSTISTGVKAYSSAPFAGNIVGWSVSANGSGNLSMDLWKGAAGTPAISGVVNNGIFPTLSRQISASSSTVTGWSSGVAVNDNFAWVVTSASGVSYATLNVRVRTV